MDLVEIRKKAKSRKTKKKKASKEREKVVRKESTLEQQPPEAVEKDTPADPAGIPVEPAENKEGGSVENEKKPPDEKMEEPTDSLMSLNAVLMSQHDEVVEEEEEQLQLLTFQLGAEEYALNIMDIKEIIRPRETTEVPRTPEYILGIFSLRGTIIPVLDGRQERFSWRMTPSILYSSTACLKYSMRFSRLYE